MRNIFLAAIAFIALSAQNAFAVNLTFQFDVNSSGPSIYACNAGIKHVQNANVCFDRITGGTCTPSCANGVAAACTAPTTPQSCVCTGEDNGNQGTWRLDYLNAGASNWVDNSEGGGLGTAAKISAPNSTAFATLFPNDGVAFGKQLTTMTVNLGSEVYGSEYFVDVCYRGPQIDYTNVSDLNFAIKSKVTVTNLRGNNSPNYQNVALLAGKAEVRCYMDDTFDNCTADTIPGVAVGCGNASDSFYNYNYSSNGGAYTSMSTSAQEHTLINMNTFNAGSTKRTPRFCVVRYSFKETAQTMRKWKLQQARACTYTEISEPQ
jgi:hypothetical protein